ncbi:MAG: flagellar hook-basal body complex protein FliE [Hyphomicrobiaceae bacterium]|uniref:flagellar hook-basal body complex protein FliE n=1 Tax=Pseudorhodoplanes sp. TaxID=1934341 RepID=UPI003D10E9C9
MNIDPISGKAPSRSFDVGSNAGLGELSNTNQTSGAAHTDFSSMLSGAIEDVAHQLRHAEAISIAGIKGKASTQEVVEQVMQAEQVLQASIAVRDKVVAAYLEISRMQI